MGNAKLGSKVRQHCRHLAFKINRSARALAPLPFRLAGGE